MAEGTGVSQEAWTADDGVVSSTDSGGNFGDGHALADGSPEIGSGWRLQAGDLTAGASRPGVGPVNGSGVRGSGI